MKNDYLKYLETEKKTFEDWESKANQSLKGRKFLNIGAGKFRHRYWTNLDYNSDYYKKYIGEHIVLTKTNI